MPKPSVLMKFPDEKMAKDLPDGEYDYYFNFEDKVKVFKQSVKELAKKLGINYDLIIEKQ